MHWGKRFLLTAAAVALFDLLLFAIVGESAVWMWANAPSIPLVFVLVANLGMPGPGGDGRDPYDTALVTIAVVGNAVFWGTVIAARPLKRLKNFIHVQKNRFPP